MPFLVPKQERFVVPLAILQIVAREQFFDEFQLFIYLKSISDGGLKMNRAVLRSASHHLECHQKTVKRRLERLKKRNWIGTFKCGVLILRSFNELFRVEKIDHSQTAAIFYTSDLKKLTAFVVSACIGYLVIAQRAKLWKKRRGHQPGAKKAIPIPPGASLPTSFPVACKYIADIFGVSISTASEWKRMGANAGFLSVEKQLEYVDIDNRMEYKRLGNEDDHFIVFRKGYYFYQGIDMVESLVGFKSRRKPKPKFYKSGQMPKHNKSSSGGFLTPNQYELLMQKRHNK